MQPLLRTVRPLQAACLLHQRLTHRLRQRKRRRPRPSRPNRLQSLTRIISIMVMVITAINRTIIITVTTIIAITIRAVISITPMPQMMRSTLTMHNIMLPITRRTRLHRNNLNARIESITLPINKLR